MQARFIKIGKEVGSRSMTTTCEWFFTSCDYRCIWVALQVRLRWSAFWASISILWETCRRAHWQQIWLYQGKVVEQFWRKQNFLVIMHILPGMELTSRRIVSRESLLMYPFWKLPIKVAVDLARLSSQKIYARHIVIMVSEIYNLISRLDKKNLPLLSLQRATIHRGNAKEAFSG